MMARAWTATLDQEVEPMCWRRWNVKTEKDWILLRITSIMTILLIHSTEFSLLDSYLELFFSYYIITAFNQGWGFGMINKGYTGHNLGHKWPEAHMVPCTNYKRHTFVKMDIAQSQGTQLCKQFLLHFFPWFYAVHNLYIYAFFFFFEQKTVLLIALKMTHEKFAQRSWR